MQDIVFDALMNILLFEAAVIIAVGIAWAVVAIIETLR